MPVRPLIAGVLAAAAAVLALPAAAGAAPTAGVVAPVVQCERTLAAGAPSVKFLVRWGDLQTGPHTPTAGWSDANLSLTTIAQYRACFSLLRDKGVEVFVVIYGAPGWARDPGAPENAPPDPADVGQFRAFMQRLSGDPYPGPTDWSWHGVVNGYMIWNEPDGPAFWDAPGGPDAAAYVPWLKAGYEGVKAGDPEALVGFAPLTGGNENYLAAAWAAEPDLGRWFDAVPVDMDTACNLESPYSYLRTGGTIMPTSFLGYRDVRDLLAAKGKSAPIWMELGWSSPPEGTLCNQGAFAGRKAGGVSRETQATYLRQALHCVANDPSVDHAWWFLLQDDPVASGPVDGSFGLFDETFRPKPVFAAFQDLIAGLDTLTGQECGDFSPPTITILSPAPDTVYAGPLPAGFVTFKVNDPAGVVDVNLTIGDKVVPTTVGAGRRAVTPNDTVISSRAYAGAGNDTPGAHPIRITARDALGNPEAVVVRPLARLDPSTYKATADVVAAKPKRVGKRRYTVAGTVTPVGTQNVVGLEPEGFLRVQWSIWASKKRRVNGRIRTTHFWKDGSPFGKHVSPTFSFTSTLAKAGRWRVRLIYTADPPFASVKTKWVTFTAR